MNNKIYDTEKAQEIVQYTKPIEHKSLFFTTYPRYTHTLYKTQIQFSELFNKKYSKEFDENLDIDPDTFNLLLEDEMKIILDEPISREAIRRTLKKTGLSLTEVTTGTSRT